MATFYYEYGFIGPLSELQDGYCEIAGMYSDAHKELNGSRWCPSYSEDMTLEQNFEYLHASYTGLCQELEEEAAREQEYEAQLLRDQAAHKRNATANATANAELRLKLSAALAAPSETP
jgi:hypothetical protein